MGKGIVDAVHCEFTLDIFVASAAARTLGVAALRHKTVYNAVECQTVIKSAFYEF